MQVKSNQKTLLENIEDPFAVKKIASIDTTEDCGHGRVEVRKCCIISDLEFIDDVDKWKDLQIVVKNESKIYLKKDRNRNHKFKILY